MKIKRITLVACFLIFGYASGQSIERSVIGSAGGISTTAAAMVSWNVGEAVINTLSAGNSILTQGFEQPPIPTSGVKSINANSNIQVFPNPTSGLLTITLTNPINLQSYSAEVRDVTGKLVFSSSNLDLSHGSAILDLSHTSDGCYFLQLKSENQASAAFKITLMK